VTITGVQVAVKVTSEAGMSKAAPGVAGTEEGTTVQPLKV
jgi:hypothetical protein